MELDKVKSSWSICVGLHTRYNEKDNMHKKVTLEKIIKNSRVHNTICNLVVVK